MKAILTAAALVLALAACDKRPEPQGETTGAAMPDTSQATPVPDATQTAPDAGDTGMVPADGSPPSAPPLPSAETAEPAKK
jgi:uncharacterized lipoprotein